MKFPEGLTELEKEIYRDYFYFNISKGKNKFYVRSVERHERISPEGYKKVEAIFKK